MLTIKLYQFSKHRNSTEQPTVSTPTKDVSGLMKTPSSIVSPVMTVKENPTGYNYCHISDLSRYYFITDISYVLGEWQLSLNVDTLASFKTAIGNTSAYVLRSASNYTALLKDTLYPMTGAITSSVQDWGPYSGSGYFYVSVVGNASNSVVTYQMTSSVFYDFMSTVLGYGADATLWNTVEQSIKNSIFNPIDYIANCFWLPLSGGSATTTSSVVVGNYTISLSGSAYVYTSNRPQVFIGSFSVGAHPQSSARGNFCNLAPYSEYILSAAGFGNIQLPADLFVNSSNTVVMRIAWDIKSGAASLVVLVNGVRVARVSSSIGVSIPLTQINRDILGGIVQLAIGGANAMTSISTGNLLQTVAGVSQTVNGMSSIAGTVSTTGSLGSSCNLYDDFHLTTVYHTIADNDNANNGRPYCKYVAINTLSGYLECEKGTFKNASALESEMNEINGYFTNGFYYE